MLQMPQAQLSCSLPIQTVGRFSKLLDRSQPCQLRASCPELQQQKVQGGEQKVLVSVPRHSQLQTGQGMLPGLSCQEETPSSNLVTQGAADPASTDSQ